MSVLVLVAGWQMRGRPRRLSDHLPFERSLAVMRDLAVDLALDAGEFLLDLYFTRGGDGHSRLPGDGGAGDCFSAGDRFPKLSRGTAPRTDLMRIGACERPAIESVMLPVVDLDPVLWPAAAIGPVTMFDIRPSSRTRKPPARSWLAQRP
jgi:hypothetical protein